MPVSTTETSKTSRQLWFDLGFVKAETAASDAPWTIYMIASTPRIDHEGERVLPEALKSASQYLLDRGKVSFEHVDHSNRHDASILIGEPTAIRFTDDGQMLVQAMLYKHQPTAQSVWNILQSGGKLGASIGGAVIDRKETPGQPTTIRKVFLNHIAITSWPMNEDTTVQLHPFAAFLKALGAADAGPMIMEDLEGTQLGGLPEFTAKWHALAEQLAQQYAYDDDKAHQMALAVLISRGEARQAFVAHSLPSSSSLDTEKEKVA